MNKIKTINRIYALIFFMILGVAFFQVVNPVERPQNINGLSQLQILQGEKHKNETPRHASGVHLTAGICALMLVGYMFWFMIRKFQRDSRVEMNARKNTFYMISLATGRTEYDLFNLSAKGWPVSAERIEQDFKRYMSDQVMPHYANDFVRKNQSHIDESLFVKKDVKPTSWTDWAIAVLVFPGSLLILFILMMLFDKQ
jgi:hypothetical protein